jgi:methylmalonyl-CoA mutase C-terminal domain/subunit
VLEALRDSGAGDIPVVVGGTIPPADVPRLIDLGVAAVVPTSTPLEAVVTAVRTAAER